MKKVFIALLFVLFLSGCKGDSLDALNKCIDKECDKADMEVAIEEYINDMIKDKSYEDEFEGLTLDATYTDYNTNDQIAFFFEGEGTVEEGIQLLDELSFLYNSTKEVEFNKWTTLDSALFLESGDQQTVLAFKYFGSELQELLQVGIGYDTVPENLDILDLLDNLEDLLVYVENGVAVGFSVTTDEELLLVQYNQNLEGFGVTYFHKLSEENYDIRADEITAKLEDIVNGEYVIGDIISGPLQ